jgi:hypothetical protein
MSSQITLGLNDDPRVGWIELVAPIPMTRRFWNITPNSRLFAPDVSILAYGTEMQYNDVTENEDTF